MKVLLIGSDLRVAELVAQSVRLRWPNASLLAATTPGSGLGMVAQTSPDVVILGPNFSDMTLPGAILQLRRLSNVPLIALRQRGRAIEAVSALVAGADAYIRLPCDARELMARIWALVRRAGWDASAHRQRNR